MVMWGRSVHITTLFFLGKLEQAVSSKRLNVQTLNDWGFSDPAPI